MFNSPKTGNTIARPSVPQGLSTVQLPQPAPQVLGMPNAGPLPVAEPLPGGTPTIPKHLVAPPQVAPSEMPLLLENFLTFGRTAQPAEIGTPLLPGNSQEVFGLGPVKRNTQPSGLLVSPLANLPIPPPALPLQPENSPAGAPFQGFSEHQPQLGLSTLTPLSGTLPPPPGKLGGPDIPQPPTGVLPNELGNPGMGRPRTLSNPPSPNLSSAPTLDGLPLLGIQQGVQPTILVHMSSAPGGTLQSDQSGSLGYPQLPIAAPLYLLGKQDIGQAPKSGIIYSSGPVGCMPTPYVLPPLQATQPTTQWGMQPNIQQSSHTPPIDTLSPLLSQPGGITDNSAPRALGLLPPPGDHTPPLGLLPPLGDHTPGLLPPSGDHTPPLGLLPPTGDHTPPPGLRFLPPPLGLLPPPVGNLLLPFPQPRMQSRVQLEIQPGMQLGNQLGPPPSMPPPVGQFPPVSPMPQQPTGMRSIFVNCDLSIAHTLLKDGIHITMVTNFGLSRFIYDGVAFQLNGPDPQKLEDAQFHLSRVIKSKCRSSAVPWAWMNDEGRFVVYGSITCQNIESAFLQKKPFVMINVRGTQYRITFGNPHYQILPSANITRTVRRLTEEDKKKIHTLTADDVIWYWRDDDGKFKPYTAEASRQIEVSYQQNNPSCIVSGINNAAYMISFAEIVQFNMKTRCKRPVKRGSPN